MAAAQSDLRNLQRVPSDFEPHNYADFIELLCLANLDGEVSHSDVIDRIAPRQKDLGEGDYEENREALELDSDDGFFASNRSMISDKWDDKLRDWFLILSMRVSLYGEVYPFIVDGKELKVRKKKSAKQLTYIYLLLCSNLYLFPKREGGNLANAFEVFCLKVFKQILPKEFEVHLFGKNQYNARGRFRSSQSLWSRMHAFARAINEDVSQKISETEYHAKNTGDEGLDLIAWLPTADELPSKIVLLGQCACGKDWIGKQHQSGFDAWSNKISFTNYTVNNMFIPYCYRKADRGWHKPSVIHKTFLIDRKRLLEFSFKGGGFKPTSLPVYKLLKEICGAKEAPF